jgi:hypothetical protein
MTLPRLNCAAPCTYDALIPLAEIRGLPLSHSIFQILAGAARLLWRENMMMMMMIIILTPDRWAEFHLVMRASRIKVITVIKVDNSKPLSDSHPSVCCCQSNLQAKPRWAFFKANKATKI